MSTAILEMTDEQAAKLGIKGRVTFDELYANLRSWEAYKAVEANRDAVANMDLTTSVLDEINEIIAEVRRENSR